MMKDFIKRGREKRKKEKKGKKKKVKKVGNGIKGGNSPKFVSLFMNSESL